MTNPDWRTVELDEGIVREPTPDANRIVLWLPGAVEAGYRNWERITTAPGAQVVVDGGICTIEATSMPARQKIHGFFGKLLEMLRKPAGHHFWLLPNRGYAEQTGERQSGLLLVWAEDDGAGLSAVDLQARWTEGEVVRKVGRNLFVVNAVQAAPVRSSATVPAPGGSKAASVQGGPREQAENLLAAARQAGDRRAEATALADLGITHLVVGEKERAVVLLEEALTTARQLGDRARESDVLGYLAIALQAAGQGPRAMELLDQKLAFARQSGDQFEEKLTLANLAAVHAAAQAVPLALDASAQALTLARVLGDRRHEAELLWFRAVLYADLGQDHQAVQLAQSAIDIHATLRSPHVAFLADHLKKYRGSVARLAVPGGAPPSGYYTGPTAVTVAPAPAAQEPAADAGLLKTAYAKLKAAGNFVGPEMKTVSAAVQQKRLETCAACPHHTGMRCKLCGCFTSVKSWLRHENCPIGKWPG
jgi:tetratricopeptide (TPR) repeat protein